MPKKMLYFIHCMQTHLSQMEDRLLSSWKVVGLIPAPSCAKVPLGEMLNPTLTLLLQPLIVSIPSLDTQERLCWKGHLTLNLNQINMQNAILCCLHFYMKGKKLNVRGEKLLVLNCLTFLARLKRSFHQSGTYYMSEAITVCCT